MYSAPYVARMTIGPTAGWDRATPRASSSTPLVTSCTTAVAPPRWRVRKMTETPASTLNSAEARPSNTVNHSTSG